MAPQVCLATEHLAAHGTARLPRVNLQVGVQRGLMLEYLFTHGTRKLVLFAVRRVDVDTPG